MSAGPEFGSKLWWGKRDRCTAPWVIRSRSVIQAASQFNALEFPSEHITPEKGILGYEWDNTQGPACARACAAGTAYRNYLAPVPFDPADGNDQLNGVEDISQRVGTCTFDIQYTVAASTKSNENYFQ